jgi:hypothetical protein
MITNCTVTILVKDFYHNYTIDYLAELVRWEGVSLAEQLRLLTPKPLPVTTVGLNLDREYLNSFM